MNTSIPRLFVISTIAMLAACGGDHPEPVTYVGSTLFIDGIPYSQEESPTNIVPGEIVVVPKEGMREEVRTLLAGFKLKIVREDSRSLLVSVPPGYEVQWANVLRKQDAVASASLSSAVPTK